MEYAYVGMIIGFGGTFAPDGWALCNGQLLPISGNEALYSLIGTTYGGDGINNFAVPNLTNRVIVGAGQGTGLTKRSLGQAGGTANVTLSVNQYPRHTHSFNVTNSVGNQTTPTSGCTLSTLDQSTVSFYDTFEGATLVSMNPAAVSTAGGGAAHTNMMPYEEITYIIHLGGSYPQEN